jgi:hypothetical protein
MNEGFAEVDAKISGWNLVDPSDLQSTLLTDIEPVVIGPDGKVWVLNRPTRSMVSPSVTWSILRVWRPPGELNVASRHCRLQCRHAVAPADAIVELFVDLARPASRGHRHRVPTSNDADEQERTR